MKVMLINGSPHEKGCTYTALMECAKTLNEGGIWSKAWACHPVRLPLKQCESLRQQ